MTQVSLIFLLVLIMFSIDVLNQVWFRTETLWAKTTRVILLFTVDYHMSIEITLLRESGPAFVAHVRSSSIMSAKMLIQTTSLSKSLIADFAYVGSWGVSVLPHVSVQCFLGTKSFITSLSLTDIRVHNYYYKYFY